MTKAEADELVADLEAIGVEVRRMQQNQPTGWWEVTYWHKGWRSESTVTDAKTFRRCMGVCPGRFPSVRSTKRPRCLSYVVGGSSFFLSKRPFHR